MTNLNNDPPILPNRCPKSCQIIGPSAESTETIQWPVYDLIVIGGGINGTGIARDAALRGLSVLMLEKNDFGSGTSAYSSRLIHGGLRYLANLELDLVYESLAERELLLKNAPHLVRPLALGLPAYRGGKTPFWMIELGMWMYDALSVFKSLPWHRMFSAAAFAERYPSLSQRNLQGGTVYYDAQVEFPELICVENAMAAKATGYASMLNHAQVVDFELKNGRITGVEFEDTLTGQRYQVQGKGVINAAGPWLDQVIALTPMDTVRPASTLRPRIGGTLGTHIVIPRFASGPDTALYVEAESDGRPFFIIPWRKDFYLIGTTDLPFTGDLDQAAGSLEEVHYLLRETNRVLPQANLSVNDVLYSYAGVRPLPAVTADQPGKISRKHWIEDHARDTRNPIQGLVSVIGGKLTTYRNLAQATVDTAVRAFDLRLPHGQKVPKSATQHLPLPGGTGIASIERYKADHMAAASQRFQVAPEVIAHLIDLYGSGYDQVLSLLSENEAWKQPLCSAGLDIRAQVIFAIRKQMACTVSDVMLRRIGCAFNADAGMQSVQQVAQDMATELGWGFSRIEQEVQQYRALIQARHLHFRAASAVATA
ncbi:glycerol-3-phosphate dehydrogenase/oxidase [Vampirovibrio chlorellavorus]|uniref:glycerol-3-phosphate dehydrogenase/oxidase n=1 Tax=Vampirovibrio chlorellavorus TaxID=758823 RepID=UPI0026EBCC05|nr:glycerol-3-phosphate dehydrogenase/oxidase [Vampirovibrio chlorellavorus]